MKAGIFTVILTLSTAVLSVLGNGIRVGSPPTYNAKSLYSKGLYQTSSSSIGVCNVPGNMSSFSCEEETGLNEFYVSFAIDA